MNLVNLCALAILVSMVCMRTSANSVGMTWAVVRYLNDINVNEVGCYGCNAYQGDTSCDQSLPILCVSQTKFKRPPYSFPHCSTCAMTDEFYNGWSGGYLAATPPVKGTDLSSISNVNSICSKYFGPEFVAVMHGMGTYAIGMNDQTNYYTTWTYPTQTGGWNLYGYGNLDDCTRYWAFIGDQKANCWN